MLHGARGDRQGSGSQPSSGSARIGTVRPVARLYLSPPDVVPWNARSCSRRSTPTGSRRSGRTSTRSSASSRPSSECRDAAALSSGTAALHLALVVLGVGPGDEVLVPTLTFVATAERGRYVGATPVFIDSDAATWNIDPDLLARRARRDGAQPVGCPKAVIAVDLYGQCADYDAILDVVQRARRSRRSRTRPRRSGATYRGRPAGSFGAIGVFSFNGNKIITTSGGGMLVAATIPSVDRTGAPPRHPGARPGAHYEHSEIGYNYRMSNLLAAVGRAQLRALPAQGRPAASDQRALPRAALATVSRHRLHAERRGRRAHELAHRPHHRCRRVRRHTRRRCASSSRRATSRPAPRGSPCTCSRSSRMRRDATAARWPTHVRHWPVPAERLGDDRRRCRPRRRTRYSNAAPMNDLEYRHAIARGSRPVSSSSRGTRTGMGG